MLLEYKDLQLIAKYEAPEWKKALENVKGLYTITDKTLSLILNTT